MSQIRDAIETTGRPASSLSAGDFDVFIDLSAGNLQSRQLAEHIVKFQHRSGLAVEGRRITLALPRGKTLNYPGFFIPPGSAGEAFAGALSIAGAARRGLLVVQGAWIPGNEAAAALIAYQDIDPMIGTIQPRFAAAANDRIVSLPGMQASTAVMLPRAAVPYLPETLIIPELSAPLLLIVPQAVLAANAVGAGRFDVALAVLLVSLRRRGFRSLVCNRVVVAFPLDAAQVYPLPAIVEGKDNHPWRQDALRARAWLADMPERRLEALLAGGICSDGRAKVLLDCRGIQDFYNGTTHAILGYLDGLAQLGTPGLEITVLTTAVAARFHKIEARYSDFRTQLDRPDGSFLVAVRLDQPWHLHTIIELHEHAVFIAFNMLDTIAWDIIFAAPDGLDQSWRLLPRLADALLFISNFTRERFMLRFRSERSIPSVVTHLSLDRDEVMRGSVGNAPFEEPYILIFGNSFDHKGLEPAMTTLADAFPFTRIVAIGGKAARSPRVTVLQSGRISDSEINNLMAAAAVIVFPSYYEGFGLPVVHGLAHGRIVVVRKSPLWNEIAAHADLPGTLVPFDDEVSLVEAVGRALHGVPLVGLAFGGAIAPGCSAPSWRDCAQRITELVGDLSFGRDASRWVERQVVLNQLALAIGRG
jgi:glycosyltransferase involved in cell wall biosynthesis